jgi:hypothetical protein
MMILQEGGTETETSRGDWYTVSSHGRTPLLGTVHSRVNSSFVVIYMHVLCITRRVGSSNIGGCRGTGRSGTLSLMI